MEQLPLFISAAFILTTVLTFVLLFRAMGWVRNLSLIVGIWLVLQAGLTLAGFYTRTSSVPPRFSLLVLPPVGFILVLFLTRKGRKLLDKFDIEKLTLLHIVRIPVELVLFGLFVHHAVPRLMTFEGGNLDILSGLSAPLVWYFGFVRRILPRGVLIAWNIVCMILLFNIVGRAILSAPFTFQRLAFDQPNIALLYFPYSWLPAFIVPAVLFTHLLSLRQLFIKK